MVLINIPATFVVLSIQPIDVVEVWPLDTYQNIHKKTRGKNDKENSRKKTSRKNSEKKQPKKT